MACRAAMILCLLASAAQADDAAVIKIFSTAFADTCMSAFNDDGSLIEPPLRFEVASTATYGDPYPVTLWQFRCNIGVYNVQNVFLSRDGIEGTRVVTLAQPDLTIVVQDPVNIESLPKSVTITGWFASAFVVNPQFDPAKGEIATQGYWHRIGDASDAGLWDMQRAHNGHTTGTR